MSDATMEEGDARTSAPARRYLIKQQLPMGDATMEFPDGRRHCGKSDLNIDESSACLAIVTPNGQCHYGMIAMGDATMEKVIVTKSARAPPVWR